MEETEVQDDIATPGTKCCPNCLEDLSALPPPEQREHETSCRKYVCRYCPYNSPYNHNRLRHERRNHSSESADWDDWEDEDKHIDPLNRDSDTDGGGGDSIFQDDGTFLDEDSNAEIDGEGLGDSDSDTASEISAMEVGSDSSSSCLDDGGDDNSEASVDYNEEDRIDDPDDIVNYTNLVFDYPDELFNEDGDESPLPFAAYVEQEVNKLKEHFEPTALSKFERVSAPLN
jgi:hypothetical protein